MNYIYQIIIVLIFLGFSKTVKAQYKEDHLEPVASIFDISNIKFEYYSKVRKVLFNGLSDTPEIRFLVIPSFSPENVLDIEFDRDNNKYYIVYHICEKKIWYNKKWYKVKVKKYKKEIDKESVKLIKSLFEKAIARTKFTENETLVFTDGTQYYFSVNKFGLKSGTVWSPSDGTKMRKLVDIGTELIKLAKSENEVVKINKDLRRKIENLMEELK